MMYFRGDLTGAIAALVLVAAAAAAWWLVIAPPAELTKPSAPPAPATTTKTIKEDQLNVITLTPEAMARLAVEFAVVEKKSMPRHRVYGGEVIVPMGQSIIVSAPLSGMLKGVPGEAATPGSLVRKGQTLFQFLPLLSPEGRANMASAKIDAEGQLKSAETQVGAARIALDRASQVFQSQAGSRKTVDEAQAQHDLAVKAVEAAAARKELLDRIVGEVEKGTAGPLPMESPSDGMLRNIHVMAGQTVPAGSPLFEVVDLDRVWVRVPAYVGDLSSLDVSSSALVGELTMKPGSPKREAKRVSAPPTASLAAGTVDLYYELDNRQTRHSPGQRVAAELALKDAGESLTLPWSAVIHDIYGSTWVYEQTGDRAFTRRRVVVTAVTQDVAVLATGPAIGAKIVTAGAAELFGTETGFSK